MKRMNEDTKPADAALESELDDAMKILSRGADAIISETELRAKLRAAKIENRPLRVKLGLDPTAPDIHLGFAVVLQKLRQFQDLGHEAHLIIGDFTAQIGDPTGKSKTRPQLTRAQVEDNARTYREQLFRILDESKTVIHFNGDWLGVMSFSDVIQLAAKYTVAQTLEREDFAQRLSEHKPIGLHEILYPLCQGRDSVEIKADVELGGSDQRFNNLVGRELQRADGQSSQVVLLMPLLVGTDGAQKMSKSLGNFIGITEAPEEMFGKIMSLPDDAMPMYFTLATQLPEAEVARVLAGHPMDAKKLLGREIVAKYHDKAAARAAQAAFEKQSRGEMPEHIEEKNIAAGDRTLAALLREVFGVSGSEARRLVEQNAVTVDGVLAEDANFPFAPHDGSILKMGKRRYAKLKISD